MSLQKITLTAMSFALAAGLCFTPAYAADAVATPALTKEQVQQIVHDYIMDNPKLIMDSVDDYQKKSMETRSTEGLKKNKDILVKDTSSPEAGNPNGDVTIVEFFDYNCHFCKGAFPAIQSLLESDKKVRVVFKEFPILGPSSETASKWALAAQKQKKYFEFHKEMMANKEPITDDLLEKVAKDVGMDVGKAKMDLSSPDVLSQIDKTRSLAIDLGINGTPAFIIGDDIERGAVPESVLKEKIASIRATAPAAPTADKK